MNNENTWDITAYIKKADKALIVCEDLIKMCHFSDAVAKAYFAMFYAVKAFELNSGIQVRKHSAVISKFGENFIKTGRIDRKYHKMLNDAFKKRQMADYKMYEEFIEEIAIQQFENAKQFVSEIKLKLDF